MAYANKYLTDSSYVVVYKHQGKDLEEHKIDKPAITPIATNRDTASTFLKEIQTAAANVQPIEPVFVDFSKDLSVSEPKPGLQALYKQNTSNDIFNLMYIYDLGSSNDKLLSLAGQYLDLLGTSDMTAEEVKSEFYRLGCWFNVSCGTERSYITLSGLNENMPQAVALFEKLLADAQVNKEAYVNLVNDQLKRRADAKLNQSQNFARLMAYTEWGPQNYATYTLSEKELKSMNPQELVDRIHNLDSYKHRITYYGPSTSDELLAVLKKEHKVPATLQELPEGVEFKQQLTPETKIFLAPYDAKQIYMSQISNRGEKYDPAIESGRQLYNEYFGGGMNSIVFQEMRESRGLAYSAWAGLDKPSYPKYNYTFSSYIATQNDKMMDAIKTFNDIIENMPQSEAAFKLAKEGMIARLRTERILKSSIIWAYINAQDFGEDTDSRRRLYDYVQNATLQEVVNFQQKWIKGRTYNYCILGDKKELDMEALKKMGQVVELKTEDIFGY